jgi:hypothetical protein
MEVLAMLKRHIVRLTDEQRRRFERRTRGRGLEGRDSRALRLLDEKMDTEANS